MHQDSRIYVAGHRGLVGSALMRALVRRDCAHLITRTHADLDLACPADVERFFAHERPEFVFLAAARSDQGHLGGEDECLRRHLAIHTNVIHQAWRSGVRRLLILGASSLYPPDCPSPIRESYLGVDTSPLRDDAPCVQAKRAGIEMCWSYNRKFGTRYLAAMPCRLYGPGDRHEAGQASLVPTLIQAFHQAKVRGDQRVELGGDRTARQDLLFSDDLAEACVHLMIMTDDQYQQHLIPDAPPLFNVGSGAPLRLETLAEAVRKVVGYRGEVIWDAGRPGFVAEKPLDASRVRALGWSPATPLEAGVRQAYAAYLKQVAAMESTNGS